MSTEGIRIDNALDGIKLCKWHIFLLTWIGIIYMFAAMNLLFIGLAIPAVSGEFSLNTFQQSIIISGSFIGMFIGAGASGFVADHIGRKKAIILFFAVMEIFMIITAGSWDWQSFFVFRIFTGIGIGAVIPLSFVYLSEFIPSSERGKILVLLDGFWALGWILAALEGYVIIPTQGWRLYFIAGGMGIVMFPFTFRIPNSPRYLLIQGKEEQTRKIVNKIRVSAGAAPIDARLYTPEEAKIKIKTLWTKEYRRRTVLAWAMWFCMVYGYYSIFMWITNIMIRQYHYPLPVALSNAMLSSFSQLPGYFVAAWLVDVVGRKKTLISFLTLGGISVWIFIFTAHDPIGAILLLAIMGFFILGAWGVVMTYTTELYPTALRGRGYGSASGFGRFAGIIGPYIVGAIIETVGIPAALTISGIAFIVNAILIALLGVETKLKSLEETGKPEQ
ncbi:MAG: MFS transporter [Candidatus Korarchaeota archaeon]